MFVNLDKKLYETHDGKTALSKITQTSALSIDVRLLIRLQKHKRVKVEHNTRSKTV